MEGFSAVPTVSVSAYAGEVSHGDVAAQIGLINMLKIKYMDCPEVYKTLLAFLCDYNPSQPGSRERTLRYIRLLIKDEGLVNCIVMSLPEPTAQDPCSSPLNMTEFLKLREQKSRQCVKPTITPHPADSRLQLKASFSPLQAPVADAIVGEQTRPERKMVVTTKMATKETETKSSSLPVKMSSPAIITCEPQPSTIQMKKTNSGVLKSVKQSNGRADVRRKPSNTHMPYTRMPTVPVTGAWSQGQAVRGQGQFPVTTASGQLITSPVRMMLPFQYGDYRFPFQNPQYPGLQSAMGLGTMMPWQYASYMTGWAQTVARDGGLDLSQQSQPVDLTRKSAQKHTAASSHTTGQNKLKRCMSTTSTAATLSKENPTRPKLQKLHSDSVLHKPDGMNKDIVVGSVTPDGCSASLTSPLLSLQQLVSTIESRQNSQSKNYDTTIAEFLTAKDLKESENDYMKNNQCTEQTEACNSSPLADSKTGNPCKPQDIPSSTSNNASRAFPYSQKINLPNGKYSVVSLHGENKTFQSCSTHVSIQPSVSQSNVSQDLPLHQLMWSKASQGPVSSSRRSLSLSDLLKLTPAESSMLCSEGEMSNFITETSKTQNSTTVKIKLNTSNSDKLLAQILSLQQAKGYTYVQSSQSNPDQEIRASVTVPGDMNDMNNLSSQGNQNLPVKETAVDDAARKVPTPVSAALKAAFNTSLPGQAFAIQAKPDFTSNRISVTDKAFLHTIKQRLQSRNKQQRANSDSALLTSSLLVPTQLVSDQLANIGSRLDIQGTQSYDTAKGDGSKLNCQDTESAEVKGLQLNRTVEGSGSQFQDTSHSNSRLPESCPYLQETSQEEDSGDEDDEVFM